MDEVLFHSQQKLENLQVQLDLAASHSRNILQQYSQQGRSVLVQLWQSPTSTSLKSSVRESYAFLINILQELRVKINCYYLEPARIYYHQLQVVFTNNKWSQRDVCFLALGLVCGVAIGVLVAVVSLRHSSSSSSNRSDGSQVWPHERQQAIQCTGYVDRAEMEPAAAVVVVEDTNCDDMVCIGDDEVVVAVKAGSIHMMDAVICEGRGRTLRKYLRRLYQSKPDVPVTLGRDCTGIVTDIGRRVHRLDVGDAVWLTVPFWWDGTLSTTVRVPADKIARKPHTLGFEAACSLPYAGTLALDALRRANLTADNTADKRILIHGCCTPIGCVLIQILFYWQATIIATCSQRAQPVAHALGCTDVIVLPDDEDDDSDSTSLLLTKELELREPFNVVIVTSQQCYLTAAAVLTKQFQVYCCVGGRVVSTAPFACCPLFSSLDSFGLVRRMVFGGYLRVGYYLEKLFCRGTLLGDFAEAHDMCYPRLDELSTLVDRGHLQTVVDKVFHPQEIQQALNYIRSSKSIGSTVITFR